MDLEYNSDREHLIIPEYGRHIQKLVNHCINLEDIEVRNTMAKAIVNVMGNMQPHLREMCQTFNINYGINCLSCLIMN